MNGWGKYFKPPEDTSVSDDFLYFSNECFKGCAIKAEFDKDLIIENYEFQFLVCDILLYSVLFKIIEV